MSHLVPGKSATSVNGKDQILPAIGGPGGGGSSSHGGGLRYPSNGKTIYHRPLNRSKTSELSQASFAYLFSEMVSYAQKRVTGIQELEKRYVFFLFLSSFNSLFPSYLVWRRTLLIIRACPKKKID